MLVDRIGSPAVALIGSTLMIGDLLTGILHTPPMVPVMFFFVTFMAEKGDVVTLSAAGTDGDNDGAVDLDTLLYLFDFRGNRLAVDDDTGGTAMDGVPLSSLIENFEIPNEGLYLVFATAYNFDEAGEEGWETEGVMDFSIR
ncbi:hypothetical protein HC928_24045 [bacterium]|nr:hypothetical protein [bacterium]